jgi:hypothetical protein
MNCFKKITIIGKLFKQYCSSSIPKTALPIALIGIIGVGFQCAILIGGVHGAIKECSNAIDRKESDDNVVLHTLIGCGEGMGKILFSPITLSVKLYKRWNKSKCNE